METQLNLLIKEESALFVSDSGEAFTSKEPSNVSSKPFYVKGDEGEFVLVTDNQVLQRAKEIANRLIPSGANLNSPKKVKEFISSQIQGNEVEVFGVVFMSAQLRLIEYVQMSKGTITQTAVYPREIVRKAMELNASSVFLAHNHPSGSLEFSDQDIRATKDIEAALRLIDVKTLDHILVAGSSTLSMAEEGLM